MNQEDLETAAFNHGYILLLKAPKVFKEYEAIWHAHSPYAKAYRKGASHALEQIKKRNQSKEQKKSRKKNRGNDIGM